MSSSSDARQRPVFPAAMREKAYDLSEFTVSVTTLEEWRQVTEWGNAEGWNIGYHDAECFFAADPEGFFLGRVGDRPVAAVSLVNHSDDYAVWGHFLVDPAHRGKGYGEKIWKVANSHSGDRVRGGDAMPAMVPTYRLVGAVPVHDTIHYIGRLDRPGIHAEGVVRVGPEHLDAVAAYDRECFPADRRRFLAKWLFADGHLAYARLRDGRITGYGVIRPAPLAYRIGPLFADTPQEAQAIFDTLTAYVAPGYVSAFVPDTQEAAEQLFAPRGLAEQFRVVRMYQGNPVPKTRAECVYAIGSLELG
jgi:GNAT superfamily N-acetyltransferase